MKDQEITPKEKYIQVLKYCVRENKTGLTPKEIADYASKIKTTPSVIMYFTNTKALQKQGGKYFAVFTGSVDQAADKALEYGRKYQTNLQQMKRKPKRAKSTKKAHLMIKEFITFLMTSPVAISVSHLQILCKKFKTDESAVDILLQSGVLTKDAGSMCTFHKNGRSVSSISKMIQMELAKKQQKNAVLAKIKNAPEVDLDTVYQAVLALRRDVERLSTRMLVSPTTVKFNGSTPHVHA